MPYLNNAAVTVEKPASFKDAPEAAPGEAALSLAGLFRTRADNILFTDSGTSAIRAAVKSFIKPGDHVISTDGEHRAVLDALADESDIIGLSQKAFKHLGASMMI